MEAGFYRAFEDRHRGSRDLILQRLRAYEPFTLPYVSTTQDSTVPPKALDIGCGRGEWLQLLQSQGFAAQGIDLDAGMLTACTEHGLTAIQGDGLAYLAQQPEQSLSIVSAFHVVEHIPFDAVIQLAKEALRALQPGGLVILETPNPENVLVACNDFYLDPSHEKPIPPHLLAFVLEYVGFTRVKIVRLNENPALHQAQVELGVWDTVSGASPDYAVVAQKGGHETLEKALAPAFEQDYGLDLQSLMLRYDQGRRDQWQRLAEHNEFVQGQIVELSQFMQNQEASASHRIGTLHQSLQQQQHHQETLQQQISQLHELLQQQLAQANAQAHQWFLHAQSQEQLAQAVLQSKSWRLTKPLRAVMNGARRGVNGVKPTAKKGLKRAMQFTLARPALRNRLNQVLQKYPRLYARLLRFAHHQGLVSVPFMATSTEESMVAPQAELQDLSPRARDAYRLLLRSLDKKKKG